MTMQGLGEQTGELPHNLWDEELDTLFEQVAAPPPVALVEQNPERQTSKEFDKKAKRRAAVAAASRATRAKRKRELEDLRDTNKRLEEQREKFLDTIAELQMKVQALRETGSIDLRMENDLLRAELAEHKQFISQFKRIADGIPTSHTAKHVMCKQGANTAIAQVLGLTSTSSIDATWLEGSVPEYPNIQLRYQRLPHGVSAAHSKRTSVRMDIPFIPLPKEYVVKFMWRMWTDPMLLERFSRHYGTLDVSVREIDTGLDDCEDGDIKMFYYRETIKTGEMPPASPAITRDTVHVIAKRDVKVSASSFMFPGLKVEVSNGSDSKRGSVDATVLATTSTQHASEIEPEKPGVHRIRSAQLEGGILRDLPGGCGWTVVMSHPSAREDGAIEVAVKDDGTLASAWVNGTHELHAAMIEEVGVEKMKLYQAANGISKETVAKWHEMTKAKESSCT